MRDRRSFQAKYRGHNYYATNRRRLLPFFSPSTVPLLIPTIFSCADVTRLSRRVQRLHFVCGGVHTRERPRASLSCGRAGGSGRKGERETCIHGARVHRCTLHTRKGHSTYVTQGGSKHTCSVYRLVEGCAGPQPPPCAVYSL